MAISKCLKDYLDSHGVDYRIIPHRHTSNSTETAEAAHISGFLKAK